MADREISRIDEISISLIRSDFGIATNPIQNPEELAMLIRKIIKKEEIEAREKMIALYFNRNSRLIGYFAVGVGGVGEVVVDVRLVLGVAVKTFASGIVLSHNHPSGSLKPSRSDLNITKKVREAAAHFDIVLMDHVIVTKDGYYSFADDELMGVNTVYPMRIENHSPVVELIEDEPLYGTTNQAIENLRNELRTYIEENQ